MQQLEHLTQKFPEVFASRGRQSPSFVSALMVMYSPCVCVCEHSVKYREKSRESQKMSWFLISSRPRDGWQRFYAAKASAQRHARVHAELAPSMPPSRSHRYRRNPRKCSAGRNLGRAPFDTARCELAGGQPFFMKAAQ